MRTRVQDYFQTNGIEKHANNSMITKTVLMLSLFFIPLLLINLGIITQTWILFFLYIASGLGMAGIGMGVAHDAIHGSYSKHKRMNTIIGYTFNMIGANATVWKIQHNVLHHSYTNIDGADDDINAPFFLRFSPHAEKNWLHKYQHIYVWFFYGLATLSWVTTKDFVRVFRYRDMGMFKRKNEFRNALANIVGWKVIYYSYALVVPLLVINLPWYIIVLAFLSMHFVTGLLISIVFQISHITPDATFPSPDENGQMTDSWYKHQLATTANFSPRGGLFSWLIGGLNYQVEHHCLPSVCHVHYKGLSKILGATAKEYDMPYHTHLTFLVALKEHAIMLKKLGNMPQIKEA